MSFYWEIGTVSIVGRANQDENALKIGIFVTQLNLSATAYVVVDTDQCECVAKNPQQRNLFGRFKVQPGTTTKMVCAAGIPFFR